MGVFDQLFGCAPKTAATTEPATTAAAPSSAEVAPAAAATSSSTAQSIPPICTSGAPAGALAVYDKLLVDGDLAKTTDHINSYLPICWPQATPRPVQGWSGIVAELQSYSSIQTLVLVLHGQQGQMDIYKDSTTRQPKYCSEVAGLFAKCAPEVKGEIVLDNCRTGANPKELISLLDVFRAPKITAWNYYMVISVLSVTPQNVSQITIPEMYLHSANTETPQSIAASSGGVFTLVYQWFRDVEDRTPPTASSSTKDFMPASGAVEENFTRTEALSMTVIGAPIETTELVKVTVTR